MLRRSDGTFHEPRRPMSRPATSTRPAVATSSRSNSLRKVDLPDPEGSTRKTNSPLTISSERSRMATTSPLYVLVTFSNRIIRGVRERPPERLPDSILASFAAPVQVSLDESVEVTVQDGLHVAGLVACALVLHELVRRE